MRRSFLILVLMLGLVETLRAQSNLVVPVAGKITGALDTNFRTDVTVRNGRDVPQVVRLEFLPAGQDNFMDGPGPRALRTLGPNETVTFEDIVGELFHTEGMGAIQILSMHDGKVDGDGRLAAAFRIHTPMPGGDGSMSQGSNAIDLSRARDDIHLAPPSTVAFATGLRHDAAFRTNVGVFSMDPYLPRTFRVTATGESGSTTTLLSVQPYSMAQVPIPPGDLGRVSIRFELLNPDYPIVWVGYGSTVDNHTGDSWLQAAVPFRTSDHHPAAALLLPAGDLDGAHGTHFRTDLEVMNHREVEETVSIGYYAGPFLYGDPISESSMTIPPGSVRTFTNVTGGLLRTPGAIGSIVINTLNYGAAYFNAHAQLSATYRIWTPLPGQPEGSMSQSSRAIDLQALPAGDQPRVVIGVRLDAAFRCNVGIANDAYYTRTFRITASSPSGSVTTIVSAPGFNLTQVALPAADLGYVTVTIEPLDARPDERWTAYATSVDNRSGDSWLQDAFSR